jgi:glyoxylase-like metal-dependent hydrolase (beta-lactamase superfamily II)
MSKVQNKIHVIDLDFLGQKNGIASFVIETVEGPILVETGPHSTLPVLEKSLESLGYKLEDVQHVLITHIHLDHAGAAWCFADLGAKIYLHPLGYHHMNDPSRLLSSAKMIYKEAMDSLWGTLKPIKEDQLVIMEHGESINIYGLDFTAWHTPGHAKHHIAWQVEDHLFTGDVAGVSIHHGPVIPPCPPPDINIEDWIKSIDLIRSLENISSLYLTHFGKITDITNHLNKLEKALDAYSSFFLPHYESGDSVDQVLPEFRDFVKNYLIDHGMNAEDAMSYEAANPSDMSATGLMRYWKKKLG